ncbi:MAG: hypothetical protein DPW09_23735 [Anaerolineae bacterium]|nr:hypothetical protein [Anaerolineales bacterium]MCQ3976454.1 hypothetical protein [Anaerolineae bacterium]
MKLHRFISYSLMTAGAVAAGKAVLKRQQWEEVNVHTAIMLDWDDTQAVATRAAAVFAGAGEEEAAMAELLQRYRVNGATHLSIPELTLNRLLAKGEMSVTQGSSAHRVYLQTQNSALADRVAAELEARLPHLKPLRSGTKTPVVSFLGDLPSVAEIGLGFDPAHAALARQANLTPIARPIGYSWVQPEMIERSLEQAAALGAKIIAFQGTLIPGHEFRMEHTVAAMRRHHLTYAYFSQSRHQKGDWFLAKNLAKEGLVILAHEFQPDELLEEDWFTASYRWANLATEAGIRLCSVRFFRILHAADPLESVAYVKELAHALRHAGLIPTYAGEVDLTVFQPQRDELSLAAAGLSIAGAAGLATDLLPVPDSIKLLGVGASALALAGLPFLEKAKIGRMKAENHHHHHHNHPHDHPHHDHHHDHDHSYDHDHSHEHDHAHEHEHDHDHDHSHSDDSPTAYAPKGLALAATVLFPAAATALNGANPVGAMAQALAVSAAGTVALSATTAESDYLLGIEDYRGYNLDWLLPMGLAAATTFLEIGNRKSEIGNRKSLWRWLPLAGLALAAAKSLSGPNPDAPAALDREHRHAHTHHLSAFQRSLGDSKMALSPKPLRKWALLAPLGVVGASILKQHQQDELAAIALTAAAAGQVATLTGFRNGQRPLLKTLEGRAKGWAIGAVLAIVFWLVFSLFKTSGRS